MFYMYPPTSKKGRDTLSILNPPFSNPAGSTANCGRWLTVYIKRYSCYSAPAGLEVNWVDSESSAFLFCTNEPPFTEPKLYGDILLECRIAIKKKQQGTSYIN